MSLPLVAEGRTNSKVSLWGFKGKWSLRLHFLEYREGRRMGQTEEWPLRLLVYGSEADYNQENDDSRDMLSPPET